MKQQPLKEPESVPVKAVAAEARIKRLVVDFAADRWHIMMQYDGPTGELVTAFSSYQHKHYPSFQMAVRRHVTSNLDKTGDETIKPGV